MCNLRNHAKGVAVVTEDGKDVFLDCDTVVLSTGSTPDTAFERSIKGEICGFCGNRRLRQPPENTRGS